MKNWTWIENETWADNDTSCENPNTGVEMMLHSLLIGLGIPGALINLAVFALATRLARAQEDPTHFFIGSMSLADGILCGTYPLQRLYEMLVLRGRPLFYAVYTPIWLGMSASAFSLVLINIDRLILFHWSLQHRWLFSPAKSFGAVLLLWVVCALHTSTGMALLEGRCYNPWTDDPKQNDAWYTVHGLLFGLLPVLSSVAVSAWLLVSNQRRARSAGSIKGGLTSVVRQPSIASRAAAQWKILRFVVATSVWTGVSLLPLRWYIYMKQAGLLDWDMAIFFGLAYLTYLGPVVNPIVTLTFHRKSLLSEEPRVESVVESGESDDCDYYSFDGQDAAQV